MAPNTPVVNITLNPNGVLAPVLTTLRDTIEVVSACLPAIERHVPSAVDLGTGPRFAVSFEPQGPVTTEQRAAYKHWILSRAFHELARGVRRSLEEAYFYLGASRLQGLTTWGKLQELLADLRREASEAKFPTLIGQVNKGLAKPLYFDREFRSLNKVRNCLEHRNGIVSERDVDPATNTLVLSLPRIKVFYEKDGAEIELSCGDSFEKDTVIMMKRITEETHYRLGDRVTFTHNDFQAIGFACWFFAQDLGSKLPKLETRAAA